MASAQIDSIKSMKDHGFPVAELSVISLAKLRKQDASELALLEKAASATGFFYLDLRGDPKGDLVLAHIPDLYATVAKYFSQPEDAKSKDTRFDVKVSQDLGWKRGYGGESFEISREEIERPLNVNVHLPQLFRDAWQQITETSMGCDEACLTLLESLSKDLLVHHRPNQPSDTGLKMVLHPSVAKLSDLPDGTHTDGGTLTLLFYKDWSVHSFFPDTHTWAYLPPPSDGCALINVANALQKLSEGRLHSPKHGVVQPFDGAKNRYYLSYFLRPETVLIEKWNAAERELCIRDIDDSNAAERDLCIRES